MRRKFVSPSEELEQIANKQWCVLTFEDGSFAGYGIVSAAPESASSPCSLTARDSMRHAGCYGRSRTLGLTEKERAEQQPLPRKYRKPVVEDAIERSIRKVQQWPYPASRVDNGRGAPVYGDRAVRVYPKVV